VRRAVFLDRDGVLNRSLVRGGLPYAPTTLQEFELLPDAPAFVRGLKEAGFLTIVFTNQPDVAVGRQSQGTVEAMHGILREAMPLDDIRICFHNDEAGCDCRKPKPGMLLAAARDHDIDCRSSYVVGDRWRDIAAGKAVGCTTIFIDYGYQEARPASPDAIVASLAEAAAFIRHRETRNIP
jgi:D-glycero-D-manno-heptose 1,7-bisphosphate phosphatase